MDPRRAFDALAEWATRPRASSPMYKPYGTLEWLPYKPGLQLRQGDLVRTTGMSDAASVDIGGKYPSKLEVRPESLLMIEEDMKAIPRLKRPPMPIVSGAADFSGTRR